MLIYKKKNNSRVVGLLFLYKMTSFYICNYICKIVVHQVGLSKFTYIKPSSA